MSQVNFIKTLKYFDNTERKFDFATRPVWLSHTTLGLTETTTASYNEARLLSSLNEVTTVASQRPQEIGSTTGKPESSVPFVGNHTDNTKLAQVNVSTPDGKIDGLLRKGPHGMELVFRHSATPKTVSIKSPTPGRSICRAAGKSILLVPILCENQQENQTVPDVTANITSRLRSMLVANLAAAFNSTSPTSQFSFETTATSTENSVTESSHQRLARILKSAHPSTDGQHQNSKEEATIAIELVMADLAERIKDNAQKDIVSAVHHLNQTISSEFLYNLLHANMSTEESPMSKKAVIVAEENASTTTNRPETVDIYRQDFWRVNPPSGVVYRHAGLNLQKRIPTAGRLWRALTQAPSPGNRLIRNPV